MPDDPIILEHLGDAFQKTNDRENALKYYKRALQEKTDNQTDLEKKILELKPEEKTTSIVCMENHPGEDCLILPR